MASLFAEYGTSSSDSDGEVEKAPDNAVKRGRDEDSSGSSSSGDDSDSDSDSDSRAAKKRKKRIAASAAPVSAATSSLGSIDDLFESTTSTFLASNATFVAPTLDRDKEQEVERHRAAEASAAAAAQMREDGNRAAAQHPNSDPTTKAAKAAKAAAAASAAAAAKGRMSAATNSQGERLNVKEKKMQQRMRGQDVHNGVWKTEQEMQLRCGYD